MAANDDMEMEKIAEDELSKLQRQFRIMEVDRVAVTTSFQPTMRMQRNIIRILNEELDKIMLELKLTKSTSNMLQNARTRDRLVGLLKEYEIYSCEVKAHRADINEVHYLLKQVQRETKKLNCKGRGDEDSSKSSYNISLVAQLENRLDTALKKFNSVNSDNYKMRLEIDRLLRERQYFNLLWKNQIKRLMEGKAQILELVEQALTTYDQREEWCSKLESLKEKAAIDYRKHCLEVRELQRQLDLNLKLEDFLRTKGTVRLTAADAKAEAKKLEKQEDELRTYNNYVNILETVKEFAGENDVDKLIQEFTRREEENYALFNYINEINTELKHLDDNVKMLRNNLDEEKAIYAAKQEREQDNLAALKSTLDEKKQQTAIIQGQCDKSSDVLEKLLQQVHAAAQTTSCDSLPLLKLLGKSVEINISNVQLYIKSLEKKVMEVVQLIKIDEALQRQSEYKVRTPPSGRRRRTPRRSPRTPHSPHTPHTPQEQPPSHLLTA